MTSPSGRRSRSPRREIPVHAARTVGRRRLAPGERRQALCRAPRPDDAGDGRENLPRPTRRRSVAVEDPRHRGERRSGCFELTKTHDVRVVLHKPIVWEGLVAAIQELRLTRQRQSIERQKLKLHASARPTERGLRRSPADDVRGYIRSMTAGNRDVDAVRALQARRIGRIGRGLMAVDAARTGRRPPRTAAKSRSGFVSW